MVGAPSSGLDIHRCSAPAVPLSKSNAKPRPASESPNLGRPLIADSSQAWLDAWITLADRLDSIAAHRTAELARLEYDAHDQARLVPTPL